MDDVKVEFDGNSLVILFSDGDYISISVSGRVYGDSYYGKEVVEASEEIYSFLYAVYEVNDFRLVKFDYYDDDVGYDVYEVGLESDGFILTYVPNNFIVLGTKAEDFVLYVNVDSILIEVESLDILDSSAKDNVGLINEFGVDNGISFAPYFSKVYVRGSDLVIRPSDEYRFSVLISADGYENDFLCVGGNLRSAKEIVEWIRNVYDLFEFKFDRRGELLGFEALIDDLKVVGSGGEIAFTTKDKKINITAKFTDKEWEYIKAIAGGR